jgi:acetyl esterase/lipase
MKHSLTVLLLFSAAAMAQNSEAFLLYKKSDSLYRAKQYLASARAGLQAIAYDPLKDVPNRMIYVAGAYNLAGLADSALACLQQLTASGRLTPALVKNINGNKDLKSLHDDERWKPLVTKLAAKATANYQIEEHIYGHKEGVALSMLVLQPKAKPIQRAIIRVVAGSWYSSLGQAENYVLSSSNYLEKGFKVFHVMVGSNPRYNIPEQIADLKRAVRYIRYHAKKYEIDPAKIGIEGGSAGGHLALAIALADEELDSLATDPVDRMSSRVQAACVLYPPTDFLNWGGNGLNMVNMRPLLELNRVWGAMDFRKLDENKMVYVPITDTAARNTIAKSISPIYAVTADDPPVFLMHGTADATVPVQQSLTLVEMLKANNVKHRFVVKPGGGHNPDDMMPEWLDAADWFKEYLK